LGAIRRLDDQARQMEATVSGPSLESIVANEFDRSNTFGGRSVSVGNNPGSNPAVTEGLASPTRGQGKRQSPPALWLYAPRQQLFSTREKNIS
jgi:hypothetical protein